MNTAVQAAPAESAAIIERVVIGGDLTQLTPQQRVTYYRDVCRSLGLNPLTKPFAYLTLNSKLVLYAQRDCTDQLRKINSVSVKITDRQTIEGVYIVSAMATDKTGRSDESTGAVSILGLKGEGLCNAMMKAETKAKRRVTLSICGLGLMDETEVESVAGAERLDPETGQPIIQRRVQREVINRETGEITTITAPVRPGTEATSDNPFGFPPSEEIGGGGQSVIAPLQQADPAREKAETWTNDALGKIERAEDAEKLVSWAIRNGPSIDKLPQDLGTMIYEAVADRRKALGGGA